MLEEFTIEEINLMCIYDTSDRNRLISELIDALDWLDDDEMFELAQSVLDKVSQMSDVDFAALELYPIYDEDEQEHRTLRGHRVLRDRPVREVDSYGD